LAKLLGSAHQSDVMEQGTQADVLKRLPLVPQVPGKGDRQHAGIHTVGRHVFVLTAKMGEPDRGIGVVGDGDDEIGDEFARFLGAHAFTQADVFHEALGEGLAVLADIARPRDFLVEVDHFFAFRRGVYALVFQVGEIDVTTFSASTKTCSQVGLAELVKFLLVLDGKALKKEGTVQPGTVQVGDIHSNPQIGHRYLLCSIACS